MSRLLPEKRVHALIAQQVQAAIKSVRDEYDGKLAQLGDKLAVTTFRVGKVEKQVERIIVEVESDATVYDVGDSRMVCDAVGGAGQYEEGAPQEDTVYDDQYDTDLEQGEGYGGSGAVYTPADVIEEGEDDAEEERDNNDDIRQQNNASTVAAMQAQIESLQEEVRVLQEQMAQLRDRTLNLFGARRPLEDRDVEMEGGHEEMEKCSGDVEQEGEEKLMEESLGPGPRGRKRRRLESDLEGGPTAFDSGRPGESIVEAGPSGSTTASAPPTALSEQVVRGDAHPAAAVPNEESSNTSETELRLSEDQLRRIQRASSLRDLTDQVDLPLLSRRERELFFDIRTPPNCSRFYRPRFSDLEKQTSHRVPILLRPIPANYLSPSQQCYIHRLTSIFEVFVKLQLSPSLSTRYMHLADLLSLASPIDSYCMWLVLYLRYKRAEGHPERDLKGMFAYWGRHGLLMTWESLFLPVDCFGMAWVYPYRRTDFPGGGQGHWPDPQIEERMDGVTDCKCAECTQRRRHEE